MIPSLTKMKEFLFSLFAHEEKKRVMSNFFFLSLLQGANYILPLLTFPYLTRVLGPGLLGSLAIASSLVAYFNPLTDFGFGFTATREIAISRNDKQKTAEIFSAVMLLKIILTTISLCILLGIVFAVPSYKKEIWLFLFTFGLTVGQVLFPAWFFQGMEQMQYVTFLNIFAKVIFTLAIFVFVRSQQDYLFVPFFQGMGFIVSGLISLWIVYKVFGIRWTKPSASLVKNLLKDSWYIFVSSLVTSIYTISSPLFLSFYATKEQVGYFYGANKIIEITKTLFGPISGALYPYLSHKAHHKKENFPHIIRKILLLMGILTFFGSLFLFVFSPLIVSIILGQEYNSAIPILRIMSFIPFFVALSTVLGIQTLLPLKKNKAFTLIMSLGSIFFICCSFLILPQKQSEGMGWVMLLTEISVFLCLLFYILCILKFPLFKKSSNKEF